MTDAVDLNDLSEPDRTQVERFAKFLSIVGEPGTKTLGDLPDAAQRYARGEDVDPITGESGPPIVPCFCKCHHKPDEPGSHSSLASTMNAQTARHIREQNQTVEEHCSKCCNDGQQMCDDCLFYAAQDGE